MEIALKNIVPSFIFQDDQFFVRQAVVSDLDMLIHCEQTAWGKEQAASPQIIEARLRLHTDTTFIIFDSTEKVLGFFSAVPTANAAYMPFLPWSYYAELSLIPGNERHRHLYGISGTILPDAPKFTATTLFNSIRLWLETSKFSTLAFGMRIPGFAKASEETGISAEDYVERILVNEIPSSGMGAAINSGGKPVGVKENFYDDPESKNFGVIFLYTCEQNRETCPTFTVKVGTKQTVAELHKGLFLLSPPGKDWSMACIGHCTIVNKENQEVWCGPYKSNGYVLEVGFGDEYSHFTSLSEFFEILNPFLESTCKLTSEHIEALLSELLEYHEETVCFVADRHGQFTKCTLGPQEDLKELSELFLESNGVTAVKDSVVVLSINIFEKSYFFFGVVEEVHADGLIFTLTDQVFQSSSRESYRFNTSVMLSNELEITEVSDNGLKVISTIDYAQERVIKLGLEGVEIDFLVVHHSIVASRNFLGLKVFDDRVLAKDAWYRFLLKRQFPLLKRREEDTHALAWNLLEETGFLEGDFGEVMGTRKESILKEWRFQDSSHGKYGLTVMGVLEESHKPVSTIGISRVSDTAWITQAAAVIDHPEYLKYTRSMYAWRIRQMLQFSELETYIAAFDANKKFLDRFFRKFYLHNQEDGKQCISWNEFTTYYLNLESPLPETVTEQTEQAQEFPNREQLRCLLDQSEDPNLTKFVAEKSAIYMYSRPHLHIAQAMSGVFVKDIRSMQALDRKQINKLTETGNGLFPIYFCDDPLLPVVSAFGGHQNMVRDGNNVLWICPREMLPSFLSNSLKSLVIMFRKYGAKHVA